MDLQCQLMKNMEDIIHMFEERMEHFDKALAQSNGHPDSLSSSSFSDFTALEADYAVFKDFIWKTLPILRQQLELLLTGYDKHEVYLRRKMLLFHGVPEDSGKQVEKKVIISICETMNLSNIDVANIEACFRFGVKKDRPRPILVRFTDLKSRNKIWKSKKVLSGSDITITEFLTKPRQEIYIAAKKHFGKKCCWTSEGTIVVLLPDKTRSKVESLSELHMLFDSFPLVSITSE